MPNAMPPQEERPLEQEPAPPVAAAPEKPGAAPAQDPKALETYRRLGLAAMKVIYDRATSAQLVEMMRAGADNPAEAIAQAAQTVLSQMMERVQGIDPKTVYAVAPAVVAFLMELAQAAKVFEASPEILQQALQMLGQQASQAPAQPEQPQQPQGLVSGAMQPQPMEA